MNSSIAAVLRAFDDGRDRSELYRGWRAGLSAGLTHPTILAQVGARGGTTKALRDHLLAGTARGEDITSLIRKAPHLLEHFESALLRMGEESGQLETTLTALADFHMRQYKLLLAVKRWLSYPMFVSLVAVVILPLPLVFQGRTTAYFVAAGSGIALWFSAGGLLLARLAQRYQRRPGFVRARFARTLALTIGAGLSLPRAVMLAAEASGDATLVRHVRRFDERTLSTQSLQQTLSGAPVMTPELEGAIRVAERTGDFATTIGRLADLYEDGFR
jgi:type II secretory pathway component PulF